MLSRIGPVLAKYLIAAAAFAALILLPAAFQALFSFSFDTTFLIILAMIGAAWYLGRGPGLLIAFLFELALIYFSSPVFSTRTVVITLNRLMLFVGVVLFASARKIAEKDLRDQREVLEVTLASIGDAVIATDISGRISLLNPAAESLTGWSESDAKGQHLDEIMRIKNEYTRDPVQTPLAEIFEKGTVVGLANHSVLVNRKGHETPIDDSGAPIRDANGSVIGAVIVFHDVSEKRESERERETLLASEQQARREAEKANMLKDDFLATVSHEMRTPLNAILGWAAMLKKSPSDTTSVEKALAIIERNARSQNKIIGDILDVSRIASGKLNVDLVPVNLSQIISSAIESLQPLARAKSISLRSMGLPESIPVLADAARLEQVFWNLISNAIKFTGEGGRVDLKIGFDSEKTTFIEVADSGVGIDPGFLPHIFERFRQFDSSIKRANGGLGLGLAIVQHIIDLHDGEVAVESDGKGHGARFIVTLPLIAANTEAQSAPSNSAVVSEPDLSHLRILTVDDNHDNLEICCFVLQQLGAETRAASTAAKAFEEFVNWRPDILVSDLGMPGEDGFDLIARIRNLGVDKGGNIPAIALTAYAGEKDNRRAIAAGYDAHVTKPVDGTTLGEVVLRLHAERSGSVPEYS